MFDCVIQNTTKKVHKSSKLFQFSEISLVLMDFYANVDLVDLNNPLVESFFIPGKLVEPSMSCFHYCNLLTNWVDMFLDK